MWGRILVVIALVAVVGAAGTAATSALAAQTGDASITMVPGTVQIEPALQAAVQTALVQNRAALPAMAYAAVSSVNQVEGWRLVSVVGLTELQADGSWTIDGAAWFGLVLARQQADGSWLAAVERTPQFANLADDSPATLLSERAKQDLIPGRKPASAPNPPYRFPWEPGTAMYYGARGVHASDFNGVLGSTAWKAVDFLSDGDTSSGHAPNRLLAAASGTIGYVCNDGTSVAIRMDYAGSAELLYVHLINNPRLYVGATFQQGDELGQLRPGGFQAACGWAQQTAPWFHVHWAFPPGDGTFTVENWTLNLSDQLWRSGDQTAAIGDWIFASAPGAPALAAPAQGSVQRPQYDLKFQWNDSPGATEYQVEYWTGAHENAPTTVGWFQGTSYDAGAVAPGTYQWHVRARRSGAVSAWSETWSVTVSPILVSGSVALTPASPLEGEVMTAQFRVTNPATQTVTLPALGLMVQGPDCTGLDCGRAADFPAVENVTIGPGQEYTYTGRRAFPRPGSNYLAAPAYQDAAGAWHAPVPDDALVTFRVVMDVKSQIYLPVVLRQLEP